jgi:hypothetical protein
MPRMQDWQQEIYAGVRRENWSLKGPNRIVKVLPRVATRATSLEG